MHTLGWPKEAIRDRTLVWSYERTKYPKRDGKIRDAAHYKASNLKDQIWTRGPGYLASSLRHANRIP